MKVKINLTGHFFIMAALFIFAVACNVDQESMDIQEAAKNAPSRTRSHVGLFKTLQF